jgi:HD-like signal output (HDOD) protein
MYTALSEGVSPLDAEARVYGLHHAEIGARLAERWNFPVVLVDAIRHHHTPDASDIDPAMASVAHLAEMVTQRVLLTDADTEMRYPQDDSALQRLGLAKGGIEGLVEPLEAELTKAKRVLEIA